MSKLCTGVFSPITTPFNPDGSLNLEALKENVRKYAKTPLAGYLALGSNGENKSLTWDEKIEVARVIIENKAPEQIVMAGSIFESTVETISFAKEMEKLGADYITLLSPCYFKSMMKDEVLIKYFTDVASALDTPCMLYNAPQFCGGIALSVKVINECAKHPNIVGIKDSSSGNMEKIALSAPEGFQVLSGSINTFLSCLLNGGIGGIISLANSTPEVVCRLYDYFIEGQYEKAAALNRELIKANLSISGKYGVAGVKYAMDKNGYFGGVPRLPLLPISEDGKKAIDACLETADFSL
jgi:4-hydroxy-2-oxoglutarate aldolase